MTRGGGGGEWRYWRGAPKIFRYLKGGLWRNYGGGGGLQKSVYFKPKRRGAPKKLNRERGGLLKFQALSFNIFIPSSPPYHIKWTFPYLFNKMNHSVRTKLAVFQCLVLLFQLMSAHILACVRLCLFIQFFAVFFVLTKLDQKNTLIFTMQPCCNTSDSMLGKIQGLFKDLLQNRRTFQERANPGFMYG